MPTRDLEAPARKSQLSELQKLTNRSWDSMDLTVGEADEWIAKLSAPGGLVAFESQQKDDFKVPDNQEPFTEPNNTLIFGEQRSGKTETAVAIIKDDSDNQSVEKFCLDTFGIKVDCVGYDRNSHIAKIRMVGVTRMIKIPDSYIQNTIKKYGLATPVKSPLNIFVNFHLFGIPFHYCPSYRYIIDGLKSGLITDGYLVMDEYYIGGFNRESGGFTNRNLAKYSNQYAKGRLKVIVITPVANQLDWKARLDPTKTIETTYNKFTQIVTCRIKQKGIPGVKEVSYDGRRYRRFYWTNEKINK